MKKLLLLFILTITCCQLYSQGYVNAKKQRCKRSLNKFLEKNQYSTPLIENGNRLELHVKDTTVRPFDIELTFNEKGRCISEYKKVDCDSCFDKWLKAALEYKYLKWTKIAENTWVSQLYMKRKMVADPLTYSILVTREVWTKEEYDRLVGKK